MIKISVHSDKRLRATVDTGDSHSYWYHAQLRALPEQRWHAEGFYSVPVTEPNLEALDKLRRVLVIDKDAATFIEYMRLTIELAKAREKRRWKYLFDDPSLSITQRDCDASRGEGEGVIHTIAENGGEARHYRVAKASFRHQAVALDAMHGQEFFALFMEMGTGKTKAMIDEIALSARKEPIDVLIVAPKTLLGTWQRELEKWLPADLTRLVARLRTGERGMEELILWNRKEARLRVILANYDRLISMKEALMAINFDMMVCDESSRLKNPNAQRTKAALEIGPTTMRRFVLSGSPVVNSVLNFFAQYEFLSPGSLGYSTYYAFKAHYANLVKVKQWTEERGYRNLDELKTRVARHAFVVKKEQCLDLPEKLYQIREVTMGPKQAEVYNQMVQLFIAELEMESGANGVVEARSTLAKLLRLAQITQGFIKNTGDGGDGQYMDISDGDGKLQELMRILEEDVPEQDKVIVWARFHRDIENVTDALTARGIEFLTLHGGTPQAQRDSLEKDFNEGPFKVLVAEPGTGGMGLTLLGNTTHPCKTHIYYSNDYSLEKRIQSEDRSHRIGQRHPVLYIDIVATGSIDEHVIKRLQMKRDIADDMKDMGSIRDILLPKGDTETNGHDEE